MIYTNVPAEPAPTFYNFTIVDIIAIIIGVVNTILVVVIFYSQKSQTTKIEKHHDRLGWYETFGFQQRINDLINNITIFRDSIMNIIDNGCSLDKANDCYTVFSQKVSTFKYDFLDVVEVVDKKLINELTDQLDLVKDKAVSVFDILISQDNNKKRKVESLAIEMRKIVIRVGVNVSLFK